MNNKNTWEPKGMNYIHTPHQKEPYQNYHIHEFCAPFSLYITKKGKEKITQVIDNRISDDNNLRMEPS